MRCRNEDRYQNKDVSRIYIRRLIFTMLGLAVVLSMSCSPNLQVAPKVNQDKALELLHTFLDFWKQGEAISDLKQPPHGIVAQDFDWIQKKKLVSYEVLDKGTAQDANLRVEVLLNIDGASPPKKVAYIIGTAPVQTVFRAFE